MITKNQTARVLGILLPVLLLLVVAEQAHAQLDRMMWRISYNTALPLGNTGDYLDNKFSWRGVGFEGRSFIEDDTSVGLSFSWNVFNKKITGLENLESVDVHGTQFRYINAWPIMVNGHKYFGSRRDPRPFVGLNAGTNIIEQRTNIGLFQVKETNWHLALAPEIGVLMPTGRFLGFFAIRYNYAFKSGNTDAQSYLGFNVGLGFE